MAEQTVKPIAVTIKKSNFVNYADDPSISCLDDSFLMEKVQNYFNPTIGELKVKLEGENIMLYWIPPRHNTPEGDMLNRQALTLAKQKNYDKAIAHWQQAIKLNSQEPNYRYNLGVVNYEKGDNDSARSELEAALVICPIYYKAHFLLGTILSKLKKYEEAARHIQRGFIFHPDNPLALINLGIIYHIQKKYDVAIKVFEKAISLSPKEPRGYFGIARVYTSINDIVNANRCYQAVIKLDKIGKMAEIAKKAIVAETGESHARLEGTVGSVDSQKLEQLYAEGKAAYLDGDFNRAIVAYTNYLRFSPKDADVWSYLAATQIRVGKPDEAALSLTRAIKLNSSKSIYYKQLAVVYDIIKKHKEAVAAAHYARELGKTDSITLGILGKNLCLLDRHTEAIPVLQNSIKANQNNFSARYYLAISLSKAGQVDSAQQQLQEILFTKMETPLKERARALIQTLRNQQNDAGGSQMS